MEDQQHAAGDLTDESPDTGDAAESDTTDAADADTPDSESGGELADESTESEEPVLGFRERRPAGKWSLIAAGVAAALFVGSAAFAGAAVQPYLTDRATVEIKQRVARTAANAITTLWTYTPENIDKDGGDASMEKKKQEGYF